MNNFPSNFKSQELVVDWIWFNFPVLDQIEKMKLANFLLTIGFNSFQQSGKQAIPLRKSIYTRFQNKYAACFIEESSYWNRTSVIFSGLNATFFYQSVKEKEVDWKLFNSAVLSRLGLYYSRNDNPNDKTSIQNYLQDCFNRLQSKKRKAISLETNTKGEILTIGNRKSNQYARIYYKPTSLRFELEMKGKFLLPYSKFLKTNNLEEFENKLSRHFYSYFRDRLILDSEYSDWLVKTFRSAPEKLAFGKSLHSNYLTRNSFGTTEQRKNFIILLQFLTYAKDLKYQRDWLGSTSYRAVSFSIRDFFRFQNSMEEIDSRKNYQIEKLVTFFNNLKYNSGIIEFFSDCNYCRLVTIPKVLVSKDDKNQWVVKVWLVEDLFHYSNPFLLPDFFQHKYKFDEFEVQFKVIEIFSSINMEKEFSMKDFFENYPSKLNGTQQKNIKKIFLTLIYILEQNGLIEKRYKVIKNGKFEMKDRLDFEDLAEGFSIYEKITKELIL